VDQSALVSIGIAYFGALRSTKPWQLYRGLRKMDGTQAVKRQYSAKTKKHLSFRTASAVRNLLFRSLPWKAGSSDI